MADVKMDDVVNNFNLKKRSTLDCESLDTKLLFKIFELDTNVVPFQKVIKIDRLVNDAIKELLDKGVVIERKSAAHIKKNLVRRGERQYLTQFKVEAFKKFSNRGRGNLIPKV